MILEGMNININDIEDDDLRKKVLKYFKTFKKSKLDDDDLVDDDEDSKEPSDEDSNDEDSKEPSDEEKNSDEEENVDEESTIEFLSYIQAISDAYMDNTDKDEYDEKDVDDFLSALKKSGDEKEGFKEEDIENIKNLIKDNIKQNYEVDDSKLKNDEDIDYDKLDDDLSGGDKISDTSENLLKLCASVIESKKSATRLFEDKGAKGAAAVGGSMLAAGAIGKGLDFLTKPEGQAKIMEKVGDIARKRAQKKLSKEAWQKGGIKFAEWAARENAAVDASQAAAADIILKFRDIAFSKAGTALRIAASNPALIAGGAAIAALGVTAMIAHKLKKKRTEKMAAGLKDQLDNEKDPEKKKELQKTYDNMMKACFDDKGNALARPKLKNLSKDDRKSFKASYNKLKSNKDLKAKGKELIKSGKYKPSEEALKNKNSSSDNNQEKDEEGNIVKQEEITDKNGKKKKVTTHTGPRGGKFYWPEGSPKDAKHKVYIGKDGKVKECMDLRDYLYESFN